LEAAETRRCASARVAAIVRAIRALSDEELARQGANPTGLFDPTTLSDSELQWLVDEFERLTFSKSGFPHLVGGIVWNTTIPDTGIIKNTNPTKDDQRTRRT
jgi:hypothetical protein